MHFLIWHGKNEQRFHLFLVRPRIRFNRQYLNDCGAPSQSLPVSSSACHDDASAFTDAQKRSRVRIVFIAPGSRSVSRGRLCYEACLSTGIVALPVHGLSSPASHDPPPSLPCKGNALRKEGKRDSERRSHLPADCAPSRI